MVGQGVACEKLYATKKLKKKSCQVDNDWWAEVLLVKNKNKKEKVEKRKMSG